MPSEPLGPAPGIGVGTWAWGNQFLWGYDPARDDQLEAAFQRAVGRGLTFFDTADSYGTGRFGGRSEALLGRFCASLPVAQRERLTVATKLAPFPWRLGRSGFDRALAGSRQRLQGKLDRVQLHWSTARTRPGRRGRSSMAWRIGCSGVTCASWGCRTLGPGGWWPCIAAWPRGACR
jgi:pyridoxine 4-dehydrogenase